MKFLLAYGDYGNANQGRDRAGRPVFNHFNWCHFLEPVVLQNQVCSNPNCGCDRSFTGLTSRKSTTQAIVVDLPVSQAQLVRACSESYEKAGYTDGKEGKRQAIQTIRTAEALPAGTIITRDDPVIEASCPGGCTSTRRPHESLG